MSYRFRMDYTTVQGAYAVDWAYHKEIIIVFTIQFFQFQLISNFKLLNSACFFHSPNSFISKAKNTYGELLCQGMKFTTIDQDNDQHKGNYNCADV